MPDEWDDEIDASDSDGPSRNGYMFIGIVCIVAGLLALAGYLWRP